MLIGITYDLRQDYLDAGYGEEETAEFDKPETIEGIEHALRALGHETDRIGRITTLVERLSRGDRWDLVFNIAEGLHGIGREAQVPALLDAYDIPYTFSDPLVCAICLHKGMSKRIVRDLGLPTPPFWVIEHPSQMEIVLRDVRPSNEAPLFAKPVAEGTSKGVSAASKIVNENELRDIVPRLLDQFTQPVLVEEFLPGREFTVGIVGTGDQAEVIAIMEVLVLDQGERGAYSHSIKEDWIGRVDYAMIPPGPPTNEIWREASELALAAWRGLGCRDAGRMDLRFDRHGKLNFIEVNPLAGLCPGHSDLPIMAEKAGIPYLKLIERIINSARNRISTESPQHACGFARV